MLHESNIKKISFEVTGKIVAKIILHFLDFIFHVEQIVKYTIAFPYIKYILDINHLFLNIFHKPRLRILILVKGFKSLEREKTRLLFTPISISIHRSKRNKKLKILFFATTRNENSAEQFHIKRYARINTNTFKIHSSVDGPRHTQNSNE